MFDGLASTPLRNRRTKIVATLGPATSDRSTIEQLIGAGANVFRLNFSHGTHDGHRAVYENVRSAAERNGATIAIFADLSGPKIRVGAFPAGPITLASGSSVVVTTRDVPGEPTLIPSQYRELSEDVSPGDRILLDDGNLELRVEEVQGTEIRCTVVAGGLLKDHKGMNLPGVKVSARALTDKDKADAAFAVKLGVDFVALSFVRSREDVDELARYLQSVGRVVPIIAKIEKPEALDHIDAILDASDAIMVARGDLGVELAPEQVPNVQEELVDLARARNCPVIVATQMLESMIQNPRPTRAEVTDVANAVRSGADAIMLSGETAAGAHPIECVRMMDTIARQTEGYLFSHGAFSSFTGYTPHAVAPRPVSIDGAVAESAAALSRTLLARGIVVLSRTGRSIAIMSAARPAAPLVCVASDASVTSFACLMWGVIPVTIADWERADPIALANETARSLDLATVGGTILLVRGFSSRAEDNAPSISVVPV